VNAPQLLSYALSFSQQSLEEVVADVTEREALWLPSGVANPIGALYLHTLYDIDAIVHRMFQDKPPLWDRQGWGKRLGVEIDLDLSQEWARSVRFDLGQAREYGAAVFKEATDYVASLGDDDLDRFITTGMGESTTLGQLLHSFVIWHIDVHCGEISALKGALGMKGYAF
jgi:hypothetical protein